MWVDNCITQWALLNFAVPIIKKSRYAFSPMVGNWLPFFLIEIFLLRSKSTWPDCDRAFENTQEHRKRMRTRRAIPLKPRGEQWILRHSLVAAQESVFWYQKTDIPIFCRVLRSGGLAIFWDRFLVDHPRPSEWFWIFFPSPIFSGPNLPSQIRKFPKMSWNLALGKWFGNLRLQCFRIFYIQFRVAW